MKNKPVSLFLISCMVIGSLCGCGSGAQVTQDIKEEQTQAGGQTDEQEAVEVAEEEPAADPLAFDAGTALRSDVSFSGDAVSDLGITFTDVYQGGSLTDEFEFFKDQSEQADLISGSEAQINELGESGGLINIADYLELMPNFSAYLDENPIDRISVTGNINTGAIYFIPFENNDNGILRKPFMRTDWVELLLDGEGEFTAEKSGKTKACFYQPYMPTSGQVSVDVVKPDGSGTETVTKNYNAVGNIIEIMNGLGPVSGVDAVNLLRNYIDMTYDGYYGTKRSDLFIGLNAAWDADELVALLRCVVANAQTLNGTDTVQGVFTLTDAGESGCDNIVRLAGELFGVRGLEAARDYLYVGMDGELYDTRQDEKTYEALIRMNSLVKEGLISTAYVNNKDALLSDYLVEDRGFMTYGKEEILVLQEGEDTSPDEYEEKYSRVMLPVARWYDGSDVSGVYMRFTESVSGAGAEGWGISAAGVSEDQNKLYAALKLIDYAYSPEGENLSFSFPAEPDEAYARISISDDTGSEYLENALSLGTVRCPENSFVSNRWYVRVPAVLPTNKTDEEQIRGYNLLSDYFASADALDGVNLLSSIVRTGNGGTIPGFSSLEESAQTVKSAYNGRAYLTIMNVAWDEALDFYATL
mgnify:CR=1 FL=1